MIRIGIMGSNGSGKTFVAKLFKYPVFIADNEVRNIYKNSKVCFKRLKKKLPDYITTFPVKKSELINAINNDKKNLNIISSIVHPLVRKKMQNFIKRNKNGKIVVLDVPLLIENKLNKKKDVLIFVKSSKSKILARLRRRKAFNKQIFKSLKENQIVLSKKKKLANYIVDKNFPLNIMKKKINLIKQKIIYERSHSRY